MQITYLGLFSRILDWVMSKIFQPVFDFISWLLGEVFTWLFNNVLSPIIEWALKSVIPVLIDALLAMFAEILYNIMAAFLQIVDYIEVAFDIFIGIRDVTYTIPGSLSSGSDSLLNAMFEIAPVRKAMLMVTVMAAAVSILFAMYATIKSMGDLEGRKPIGAVLKSCGKAALHFMLVPTMVVFILEIAAIILKQSYVALGAADSPSLGTIVFLISAFNAAKTAPKNPSFSVAPFSNYYSGKYQYYNAEQVKADFNLVDIDFLVGIGAGLFIFIMLAIVLLVFVQRLFDIVVLYIISPLFSATIPLDDGEKFSRWRDMFIGKVFSGFGAVIAMRVYLLMIPMFMDNSIDFTASGANAVSGVMNYIIRLLFVLGGAMAVQKSSSMITSLINTGAGMQEQSMSDMASGAIYGYTVGKATSLAYRGAAKAASGIGSKIGGIGAASKAKNIEKFNGGTSKSGSGSNLPGVSGSAGAGKRGPSGRAVGDGQYVKKGIATGAGFDVRGFKFRKEISGGTSGYRLTQGRMSFAKQQLRVKRGEDGKMHIDKTKVLGMTFKRGEDGKMHMSKVNTLPGFTFSRMSNGEMKLTRIGSTQMKYRIDAEGKAVKDSTLLFGRKAITHSQSGADFVAGLERDGKHMDIGAQNQILKDMHSKTRVQGPELPINPQEYIAANPKASVAEQNETLARLGYQTRVSGPDLMPTKDADGKRIDAQKFIENAGDTLSGSIADRNRILARHGYEERFAGPELPKTSAEYFEASPLDAGHDLERQNAIRARIGEDLVQGPSLPKDAADYFSVNPVSDISEQNRIRDRLGYDRVVGPEMPKTMAEHADYMEGVEKYRGFESKFEATSSIAEKNSLLESMGFEERVSGPDLPSTLEGRASYMEGVEKYRDFESKFEGASTIAEQNSLLESMGFEERVSGPEMPRTMAEHADYHEGIAKYNEFESKFEGVSSIAEKNTLLESMGFNERVSGPDLPTTLQGHLDYVEGVEQYREFESKFESAPNIAEQNRLLESMGFDERVAGPELPKTMAEHADYMDSLEQAREFNRRFYSAPTVSEQNRIIPDMGLELNLPEPPEAPPIVPPAPKAPPIVPPAPKAPPIVPPAPKAPPIVPPAPKAPPLVTPESPKSTKKSSDQSGQGQKF